MPVRGRILSLALILAVAGCVRPPGVLDAGPNPGSSKKPVASGTARPTAAPTGPAIAAGAATRIVPQAGTPTQLTGKAKLLSDHGAAIISNNTGSLVSNNGGGLVSNNGGGVVSNGGGSLIGANGSAYKGPSRYGLAQAASAPNGVESLLADATIEIRDAKGRVLVGPDGKPLTATTDGQGGYTLRAVLPAENLVLRIKLWNGGELSAILPRGGVGGHELPIDTAATLGATYVLTQFVKGDQATFDKLPATEADRLKASLDAARGRIAKVPTYQPDELVALTDDLRKQDPTVDKTLTEIKALLLGQANLGTGRAATEVPLTDPRAIADDGQGGFYVLEGAFGRIRHVTKAGAVTVYADQLHGQVKENYFGGLDLVRGPDGALYALSISQQRIWRIAPDGTSTTLVGPGGPAGGRDLKPWALAFAKDGTLWFGEDANDAETARVLTAAADGTMREPAPSPGEWKSGRVVGLAEGGDGAMYALLDLEKSEDGLYRLAPGGTWTATGRTFDLGKQGDMAAAPDGSLLVSEDGAGRILRLGMDGTSEVLSDVGSGGAIQRPTDLLPLPDGTIRVIDGAGIRVYELTPAGVATAIAGTGAITASAGDAIAVNAPFGIAYDPQGRLHVAETGGHGVRRWDGKALTTVAGGVRGFVGDGGPATAAHLDTPTALAFRGPELIIVDQGNDVLRAVGTDGKIRTVVGGPAGRLRLEAGKAYDATEAVLDTSCGIAAGPDGSLVWTSLGVHQIHRQAPDGTVHLLAGTDKRGEEPASGPADQTPIDTPFGVAFGPDGSVYFSEAATMKVRRVTSPASAARAIEPVAGVGGLASVADVKLDAAPEPAAQAHFALPGPLCVDAAGNVYVAELGTLNLPLLAAATKAVASLPLASLAKVPARVRKIAKDGTVTTIAGPGGKFFADTAAGDALALPTGLAIDAQGRLVIVDTGANLIRFLPAGSY